MRRQQWWWRRQKKQKQIVNHRRSGAAESLVTDTLYNMVYALAYCRCRASEKSVGWLTSYHQTLYVIRHHDVYPARYFILPGFLWLKELGTAAAIIRLVSNGNMKNCARLSHRIVWCFAPVPYTFNKTDNPDTIILHYNTTQYYYICIILYIIIIISMLTYERLSNPPIASARA